MPALPCRLAAGAIFRGEAPDRVGVEATEPEPNSDCRTCFSESQSLLSSDWSSRRSSLSVMTPEIGSVSGYPSIMPLRDLDCRRTGFRYRACHYREDCLAFFVVLDGNFVSVLAPDLCVRQTTLVEI